MDGKPEHSAPFFFLLVVIYFAKVILVQVHVCPQRCCAPEVGVFMSKNMQENRLVEALTRNSLYTFEFDVSIGMVEEEIVDRNGVNFTKILGLSVPCSFDAMMERAFGQALECRYTSESSITTLSRQALLDAFDHGKTKLEANLHYAAWDKYVRITYLLSREAETGHVLAYVICDDVTDLERMRGDSLHLDNTNLKRERDALTKERNDLTEERDDLTHKNTDLTEERDVLSEENGELTRAADAVHFILNAGSFVCTYNLQGNTMLGIKYSQAMRRLYGYSQEGEFPDLWDSWMDCILPEDRSYVENSYFSAVKDYSGQTLYDVTYRARQKDGAIRWQRAAASVLRRPDGTPIAGYGLVMDIDEQKRAADLIDAALEQCDLSGVQVLLVEDNDLNMEIAETFLTDAGASVTKAFNGQQAVYAFSKAPAGTFDIILMDVMMPVMDGYEATRRIRSLNRLDAKTIPIVAMTANAFAEDVEESRSAGMNEHISKPLDIGKVKMTIARYIGRKRS